MPQQQGDPRSMGGAERALAVVAVASTRTYLQQVLDAAREAILSGRPQGTQPVVALGVLLGWWTDAVAEPVVLEVRRAWDAAFGRTLSPGGRRVVSARADAMAFHVAAVRDRLSPTAVPEIPQAAFDHVRLSQSAAHLGGHGVEWQARDVAERLAWEPDKAYWREQKARAEAEIDAILDPLGRPGTPGRTAAHRFDPDVQVWQEVRRGAVTRIREHEGEWQPRAERIARTESTAAWNSGALAALASEGRTHKKWVATVQGSSAHRTRESHRLAHGQVVPLGRPFRVGQSLLQAPGDPSAPPWEVVNCRCTVVGADEPLALTASGFDADQLRVPRGNGPLSGRWVDSPLSVVSDLVRDLQWGGDGARPQAPTQVWQAAQEAEGRAEDFDPRRPGERDLGPTWEALDAAHTEAVDAGALDDADLIRAAMDKVDALNNADWTLFSEDTDLRGDGLAEPDAADAARDLMDALGDHPVRPADPDEEQRAAYDMVARSQGWDPAYDGSPGYVSTRGYSVTPSGDLADDGWDVWTPDGSVVDSDIEGLEEAIQEADRHAALAGGPTNDDLVGLDLDATIAATAGALEDLLRRVNEDGEQPTDGDAERISLAMRARIQKVLEDSGSDLTAVQGSVDNDGYALRLTWNMVDAGGTRQGTVEREFYPEERRVENAYFALNRGHQGGGIGTRMTSDLIGWYEDSGVEQVTVHANIDVGGYTWARLGFEPNMNENSMSGIMAERLPDLARSVLPAGTQHDRLSQFWINHVEGLADTYGGGAYLDEDDLEQALLALDAMRVAFDDDEADELRASLEDDPSDVTERVLDQWRSALPPAHQQAASDVQGWAEAVGMGYDDDLPTMYDLATFGQGTDLQTEETYATYAPDGAKTEHTDVTWPGKQALLGSNWYGVRYTSNYDGGW